MSHGSRIVCSAPGRAGIIGNPSDMYGGSVISCSVGMRAYARVEVASELVLHTGGQQCRISDRSDLRRCGDLFDVARATLDYLDLPSLTCSVEYESEIPVRSGLSGSTALVVALLQAILAWQGQSLDPYRLAEQARCIELKYLNVVCGYQDAYMCSFGGLNYMDFRCKAFDSNEEAEPFATVEPLDAYVADLPFLLGFTGVQHASGDVHRPIRERWLEGEPAVIEAYQRIARIACLGKRALLVQDWRGLGELMNANHAIQRDLGGSGAANERLIAGALDAGALGAKLAGAGSGGTVIALWPWEDTVPLERALRRAGAAEVYRLELAPGVRIEVGDG